MIIMESSNSLSLDVLKPRMGKHSIGIIDDILQLTKDANLPEISAEVSGMISGHIGNFLQQRATILSEYEEGDGNGDAYLFDNREKYRKNISNVIQFVLTKDKNQNLGKSASETLIHTRARLAATLLDTGLETIGDMKSPSDIH